MAIAPSPVAEATRLTDRGRTFPAANTAGMFVPASSGGRSGGQPAGTGRGRRPGNLASPPPPRLSTFPQSRLSTRMYRAEQRLCSNPPQTYAQIVILAGRKAAGGQKVKMSRRRKPVISRYTPSRGVGRR